MDLVIKNKFKVDSNMVDNKKLQIIANIMRADSIKMTTAAKSGHPSSCMSCAEIMSALFFKHMNYNTKDSKDPDNDEFILSKGHAAPILYSALQHAGCINEDLLSLRKLSSPLEGHPMPNSLDWIKVATGSLGQGLSVGVGMALAAKMQKRDYKTYVMLGDSEVAEGSIYEALQLADYYKLSNLIAIVDLNRLGQRGETMLGHDANSYKKRFEGFNWNCIVIDGHNIEEINKFIEKAKNTDDKPTMIIAKTFKGQGFKEIANKDNWHGKPLSEELMKKALKEIGPIKMPKVSIQSPKRSKTSLKIPKTTKITGCCDFKEDQIIATRQAYGEALARLANDNKNVVAIDAEVSNSTFSNKVKEKNPDQFIETFIAEQNMASIALGMSKKGHIVFASTFAAFLSRAHDQIRMAALSSADITFCGSHAGVSIGSDGASQMALEDLAMMRALPNATVFYPSDAVSTEKLVNQCPSIKGIKYIRTSRPKTPILYKKTEEFKIGDFKVLKQSKQDQITLIGAGITLHESLKAAKQLKKQGINAAVIDLYCVQPLNGKKLHDFILKHGGKVIVTEDHFDAGGIGEMIGHKIATIAANEAKHQKITSHRIVVKTLCVEGIPHSGSGDELLEDKKINVKAIVKAAKGLLK